MSFQGILTPVYNELQQVIHGVGRWYNSKTIKTNSALRYSRRVIAHVNKEEGNSEGQKITTMIRKIKVYGLIQKREKQGYTKLAWEMLHKMYRMYSDINNTEETNEDLLLTSF